LKKDSKNLKKNKNPLTAFGQMLKSALAKPASENETKAAPPASKSSVEKLSKPVSSKPEDTSPKPNLNYKIGETVNNSPAGNTAAAKTQNSNPIQTGKLRSSDTVTKNPVSSAQNVSPNQIVGKVKTNSVKVDTARTKATTDNSEKYLSLMRKKFWEKVDGEIRSGHRGRPLRINLGIDLGTSFSKVVYRLGDESFPVCFGARRNNVEDYLMPSVVAVSGKGIKCRFEFDDEEKLKNAVQIPNFKICLTCERDTGADAAKCSVTKCSLSNMRAGYLPGEVTGEEASFLSAFYLAKLIGHSKEAVRRHLPEREIPSDITVKWSANLAVPDKFLGSKVAEGFRESLEIGWLISEVFLEYPNFSNKQEAVICYVAAKTLQSEIKSELNAKGMDFDCFIYSEIGAEVASVTLSPTSEEGLYVLVDVGAGTVDTSVFRFRRVDGESVQETYAANIFKLGAGQIDARANTSFKRKSLNWLRQIKENVFSRNGEDAMIHITEELQSAEMSVITELRENLITVYREAFSKQRNIDVWAQLKLVMGGGGSAIRSYGETAREAFSPKLQDARLIEFSTLRVPKDFQMDTLPANQFHRFAVAYGLSRARIELPELIAAQDVKSMLALRQKIYIDPTNDG